MGIIDLESSDFDPSGLVIKSDVKFYTGNKYTFSMKTTGRVVGILEIDDVLFRTNSPAMLPEGQDPANGETAGDAGMSGMGLAAKCLIYLKEKYKADKERGGKAYLVTGHTDTTGSNKYNYILSRHRAQNVYSVIAGMREEFKTTAYAPHLKTKEEKLKYQQKDHIQISDWAAREFGWECSYEENGGDYFRMVRKYQSSYNGSDFWKDPGASQLSVDGDWGPMTWGAVFDCYQRKLAENIPVPYSELGAYRQDMNFTKRSLFPDVPWVGCGEHHQIEAKGKDHFRSQTNRRVEIYFFDVSGDEETGDTENPELLCKDGGCAEKDCDLYKDKQYPKKPITPVPVKPVEPWDGIPGIILYPALLTPAIVTDENERVFELLMAGTTGKEITTEAVNRQLKIVEGLDSLKDTGPSAPQLFSTGFKSKISVAEVDSSLSSLKKTESRFGGFIDSRAAKDLKAAGYERFYRVRITEWEFKKSQNNRTLYNCFWEVRDLKGKPKADNIEPQDAIVSKVLKEMNEGGLPFGGKTCLLVDGNDVNTGATRKDKNGDPEKIVSFHPVIFIPSGERPLNIGMLGDVHVTARHQVLAQSNARVIDYDCTESAFISRVPDKISPPLGGLVNVASRNLKELLDKMGRDNNIDMIVICGDLIDYIQNCFLRPGEELRSAGDVWRKVNLDGDGYKSFYRRFIDNIMIYSMIVHFYTTYHKPVFAVTGNHDAYKEPYAISPRVITTGDFMRANEGIPADTNLTIYEALVLFGRSYHEYKRSFNLDADMFRWFYSIFTPFSDYIINLHSHVLVGLAWGNDEDMIDIPPSGQGIGHLPRAQEALTGQQINIINEAKGFGKKVILATHFTFVSYLENISMHHGGQAEGTVDTVEIQTSVSGIGPFNMGTFECHRKDIYIDDFASSGGSIYCTLSGHSHRRGFYLITGRGEDQTVNTLYYDFPDITKIDKTSKPIIVVTDSAGNLPRYNRRSEIRQWGSDHASGTKVCFDSQGFINHLEAIKVGPKPRIVVALDYFDLIIEGPPWYENIPIIGLPLRHLFGEDDQIREPLGQRVIERFESDKLSIDHDDAGALDIPFTIQLSRHFRDMIAVEAVHLFTYFNGGWVRIDLHKSGNKWVISKGIDARNFRRAFYDNDERTRFVSVRFRNLNTRPEIAHYDFSSHWNYEIDVDEDESGGFLGMGDTHRTYQITRDDDDAEFPDYDFRDKLVKYR